MVATLISFLTKIPGKRYFISIFIMVSMLFILFSMVIYRHYDNAQRLNGLILYNYEVVRQDRMVLFDLVNMETGVRGYLLTGNEHFLEPYHHAIEVLPQEIAAIHELIKNDDFEQSTNDKWLKTLDSLKDNLVLQVNSYRSGGGFSFSTQILELQKQQMDDLRNMLETFVKEKVEKLRIQVEASRKDEQSFLYTLAIGTILAIIAMLIATLALWIMTARANDFNIKATESEERLKIIINGMNDGVFDFNPSAGIVYYSYSFKKMLGFENDDFPDTLQTFNNLLHPNDEASTWEVFRRYQRKETDAYHNIFRLRHKNGDWVWILSRGIGFWNEAGEMIRLIGTHMDITEHKKREEELKQVNSDLETFTYIASHDLRSPLVNLKGFADELQFSLDKIKPIIFRLKSGLSEEEQKIISQSMDEDIPEALRFIEKSTDRMDTLTTAVLNLSRIGKRQYHFETVDMDAIVRKCIEAQTYEINHKDTQVTCHSLPSIVSDVLAIEQIFSNLIENAVKYLDNSRPGIITISAEENAVDIVFAIQDNGRGIAEMDQNKIFEMFRRARNTEDVRGSGMGMSFVKATLRILGGSIWFQSSLGVGTTFYIRLPKISMKG